VARLHRDILRTLLGRIAAGNPPAGAKLPKEVDLAAELGASRGVVRECIRALEERGVVRVTHGHGATVEPIASRAARAHARVARSRGRSGRGRRGG
jgi:DNA-binding FadR family transcriptional regulator